ERDEADRRDLAGNLGNANGPAELVGRLAAGKHPTDVRQRAIDHEPGFPRAFGHGLERSHFQRLDIARRHGPADAEHAEPVLVAETVRELSELRRGFERDVRAAAIDLDIES